ncbi:MAG: hypothetical protein E6R04_10430 [Spirochaetes bacterium]|nr:MAG: hypothetical protein E6R04_10430 [Spirochaetota bacterium]
MSRDPIDTIIRVGVALHRRRERSRSGVLEAWHVGQRCRVRGRLGTIRALSQTTPCVTSVDVQLDRDEATGHIGWICTSVDELEPA